MSLAETEAIPSWSLGDRLRKAREHAGLSRDQLAAKLSVPKGTLWKWETDATRPRDVVEMADRWAQATGVPVAWLLGLTKMYKRDFGVVTWESDAPEPLTLPFDAREPDLSVV